MPESVQRMRVFHRLLPYLRPYRGRFAWAASDRGAKLSMSAEQLNALVVGLPWQQLDELAILRVI